MSTITIRDVRTFLVQSAHNRLVAVKIETSEPGLYGLGCATFTQRHTVVRTAIEDFLKPFLLGKDVQRIEDLWQTMYVNSYWRNGPVLNNAISGIDIALWDIKGKLAHMPVYQLLGGKCREGAAVYRHADGRSYEEVADNVAAFMEQGYHYIRCQFGGYGGKGPTRVAPEHALPGAYYDPDAYARSVPPMFEYVRKRVGYEVELLHDVHERLVPSEAIRLAKQLEAYRLFFLEDPLPPEQNGWFQMLRQQVAIPIAMGELFNSPHEWTPLIVNRLIDFIRIHISQIGGITPAKKVATLCEAFGVRTAWHGPGDTSPIGHAANLHLDLSSQNFGVQEWAGFNDVDRAIFPGCPEVRNGYMYANELPGLGIDFDEKEAAKHPCDAGPPTWTLARAPDGTPMRP